MLRSKFNKKKRGGSFMDAWNSGANDLKNNLKTLKNKSIEVAANTQEGITAFETSRKAQLQSRTMPGGLNPFKRRPKDHFARSGKPIGQREVLNPLNPQVQTEALSRQSAYDTAMVDFKKKAPGYRPQIAGRRKTKKRRRKKRQRKRKTKKRKLKRRKKRGGYDDACDNYHKGLEFSSKIHADQFCKEHTKNKKPVCINGKCVKVDELGNPITPINYGGSRKKSRRKKRKIKKRKSRRRR